jgi:hypothetical protein
LEPFAALWIQLAAFKGQGTDRVRPYRKAMSMDSKIFFRQFSTRMVKKLVPVAASAQHLAVMKGITSASERKEMVEALLQQTNLGQAGASLLAFCSKHCFINPGCGAKKLVNSRIVNAYLIAFRVESRCGAVV